MACNWDWEAVLWKQSPYKKPEKTLQKTTTRPETGTVYDLDEEVDTSPKMVRGRPISNKKEEVKPGPNIRKLVNEYCDINMGNHLIEEMVKNNRHPAQPNTRSDSSIPNLKFQTDSIQLD